MYIGARYVPIFADPVEWDDVREYEPLTIVTHNGDCYTSKCYVPKGAQLPPYPDGQTKYWVKTSDYNYQFADLKKTVTDLSRLVEQFQKDNEHFAELINGWNAQVQQWEQEMTAWGERLDTVESNVSDLTDRLNAEIDRAKAAEQANAAAIEQETADRKQAISELDAAYKAADTALGERIDEETALREAGDAAIKSLIEQEQNRAEGQETAIREEFAAADTVLSNRITANRTDIDAIKAEQAIQNTNISNNAKNISDNSAEIAKHAKRLTDLESNASDWDTIFPDTTIAQEVQKEEAARTNGDTALNGRCDAIVADVEEIRDIANHKVDTTTYTEGQAAQDTRITAAQNTANKANTNIGNWETDHPGQTISECATSIENEQEAQNARITALEDAPGPDLSGYVTSATYTEGQAAQDTRIAALENAGKTDMFAVGVSFYQPCFCDLAYDGSAVEFDLINPLWRNITSDTFKVSRFNYNMSNFKIASLTDPANPVTATINKPNPGLTAKFLSNVVRVTLPLASAVNLNHANNCIATCETAWDFSVVITRVAVSST